MRDAFTPLERAALDGLAWELSAVAPDLAGQIAESLPGQRRVQGPVFLTETIVDRRRPNPPETTHGRLGTIHVQIDHLEHPIAFQAEFVNGRLIALHGDAYGQDLSRVTLTGDVVDQVFALRPDGRPVPYDLRDRAEAIRESSPLRKLQANPDPPPAPPPQPAYDPPALDSAFDALLGKRKTKALRPPQTPLEVAGALVFGPGALPQGPPLHPTEPTAEDLTSVRIGVVVLCILVFGALTLATDIPVVVAGILVFWIARLALKKSAVETIARALSARRA
ncbi:hypothetical protein [Brevundimonas sp.]|jgi:hypothetical protein|uniref:hypothetical protein n=1 Tax=Brevundimonas sp. TaxID=1871086 RepID=UPI002E162311|nr:hypothetical protein [Brevundimonas sp.]